MIHCKSLKIIHILRRHEEQDIHVARDPAAGQIDLFKIIIFAEHPPDQLETVRTLLRHHHGVHLSGHGLRRPEPYGLQESGCRPFDDTLYLGPYISLAHIHAQVDLLHTAVFCHKQMEIEGL